MKTFIKSLLLLLATIGLLFSQANLYLPLNIQKAYEGGTRSYNGTPGKNFWVNFVKYNIDASFDPETRKIDGKESIVYYNNSADTLNKIVFRNYQDLFKKGNARDWSIDPRDINDGVNISLVLVEGDTIDLARGSKMAIRRSTNLSIKPVNPVLPHSRTKIFVKWSVILPDITPIRMGTYDGGQSFFVGYWYPQIAVYDDIDGWDTFQYSGLQEFYLEPANFNVKIKVPENWVIWGTGRLQNPDEVLQDKFAERYEEALESEKIINIIDSTDIEDGNITTKNEKGNVWHFEAEQAPDFAWATSNHYLWDGSLLDVGDKKVFIDAAYKKTSADFYNVAQIARKSIKYFSTEIPGIPFPYPSMTVFNGQGGMEYPMIVNDGSSKKLAGTVHLTSHEICHTYFPFNLCTNERKYAFMDEGWAVMLPFEFQSREAPGYDPWERTVKAYLNYAGLDMEIPMIIPSIIAGGNAFRPTYRIAAYNRPATAYKLLFDYLGKDLFLEAIQEYSRRWKSKHPIPYDFFFTFNYVTKQNLNWFWSPWFFSYGYPDIAIADVTQEGSNHKVAVKNNGRFPVPVDLTIIYEDSTEEEFHQKMSVWANGADKIFFKFVDPRKVIEIKLGDKYLPDAKLENNIWSAPQDM